MHLATGIFCINYSGAPVCAVKKGNCNIACLNFHSVSCYKKFISVYYSDSLL
jgi:hypothetical protein